MGTVLGLIVKAFFGIIKLFLYYIEVCDAILITFMTWTIMWGHLYWNGWASVVLGTVISLVFYIIFKHPVGFWIVTPLFSFAWTFALVELLLKAVMMPDISPTAYWICVAVCFVLVVRLHRFANIRPEIIADEAAALNPSTQEEKQWYDPRIQEMRPISTKPPEAYDTNWKYYSKRYLEADRE